MENIKYIELSYCDMPYMLQNQKCIKRKNQNYKRNQQITLFISIL